MSVVFLRLRLSLATLAALAAAAAPVACSSGPGAAATAPAGVTTVDAAADVESQTVGPLADASDPPAVDGSVADVQSTDAAGDAPATMLDIDDGGGSGPALDAADDASGASVAVYDAGAVQVTVADGGTATVTSLTVSPLTLVPPFSPATRDYAVPCAAGANSLDVTVVDATGSTTAPVVVQEGQAIVVANQYWIRCLPHDFPAILATYPSAGLPTPGYYMVNAGSYAMVLDTNATPVWYAGGGSPENLDALQPNVLSLVPNSTAPYGTNAAATFQLHALGAETTTAVGAVGSPTDAHELRLLPNGDYLLFTYAIEQGIDLTGLETFGADETMANCEIQELDPAGQEVWSWLASQHVDPVNESLEPATNAVAGQTVVDPFHCNAIDVDTAGNLLVSMRHANAVFYVDKTTGIVQWKLGGTSTNRDGATYIQIVGDPETAFNMQHDARFLPNGDVTVFDDHGAPTTTGVARGVEYAVDHTANTATMVWQFLGDHSSLYEGSFRREDDGESVICWGGSSSPTDPRAITEVDPNGNDVFDIAFSPIAAPYRGIKVPLTTLDIAWMRATAGLW